MMRKYRYRCRAISCCCSEPRANQKKIFQTLRRHKDLLVVALWRQTTLQKPHLFHFARLIAHRVSFNDYCLHSTCLPIMARENGEGVRNPAIFNIGFVFTNDLVGHRFFSVYVIQGDC